MAYSAVFNFSTCSKEIRDKLPALTESGVGLAPVYDLEMSAAQTHHTELLCCIWLCGMDDLRQQKCAAEV